MSKAQKYNKVRSVKESVLDNGLNTNSKHLWLSSDNLDVNNRADEYFKDISYFIDLQRKFKINRITSDLTVTYNKYC